MGKNILVFITLIISSPAIFAGWHNALAPSGESESIILVKDGKANYKIEGERSPKAVQFLQRNLKLINGVDFTSSNSTNTISLIENSSDPYNLGIDGYKIEYSSGNLILHSKGDTGMLNAVIAFLEEDLGWRYYQKYQKAVYPAAKITKAKVVPRRYVPPFYQRCIYSIWAFDPAWEIANKTRKGNFGKYFVHTFFKFIPPKKYLKKSPSFFALLHGKRVKHWREGQLCMSNPELRNIMAQKVIKAIEANPGVEFIAVSQNDADGYCECPNCAALLKKEKNPSGALLYFVNAVAAEVAKVYPHVIIVTEAYRYSLWAPEKVKPAANVVVRLCLNNRIASYPFFFVSETEDMKVLNDWSKKTNRLLIWDYMTNFRHYLMPRADLPVLEKNIRLYRDKKVFGVMMQTNYNNEVGTQAAMRAWVCAKLLWNPDLSIKKLANDYIYGFWGEKIAPFMDEYNSLLINEWNEFHSKNKPGTSFCFSKLFPQSAYRIIEKARVAAGNTPEMLKRIELEELTLDYYILKKGVRRESDIPAYKETLSKFVKKLKKYKIKHLAEGMYNKFLQRIEQFRDGIRMVKYIQNIPDNRIVLPATWNVYINKGLTIDKRSLVGRSMKQNADSRWGIQWRFEDFPQLIPGKYRLRIRARADKKSSKGIGTTVGIYNTIKSSYVLSRQINASELDNKKYKWLDCGTFKINSDRMFLFTATAKAGAFKAFYADAVEFIPVK